MKPAARSKNVNCRFESLESRRLMSAAPALDHSFGIDGVAAPGLVSSYSNAAPAVTLQHDGKILIVDGYAHDLVRLNTDGTLDSTFDATGAAALPPNQEPTAVFVEADGKILIAGNASPWSDGGSLVRLNADGSLDSTFGAAGRIDVAFKVQGIAQQADGALYVAGPAGAAIDVARLNADGSLDAAYGTGGIVSIAAPTGNFDNNGTTELLPTPDGKVFVVGSELQFAGGYDSTPPAAGLVFARLDPSGSIDPAFNHGAALEVPLGATFNTLTDATLLPDGSVLAAARDTSTLTLAHVNFHGTLDISFGAGGVATDSTGNNFMGGPMKLVLRPSGEIVVEGFGTEFAYVGHFTPTGALLQSQRTSTGSAPGAPAGPTPTPIPSGMATWLARSAVVDADGNLIAAGNTSKQGDGPNGWVYPLVAVRITADDFTWAGDPAFHWNPYPQPQPQPSPDPAPAATLFNDLVQIRNARKAARTELAQLRAKLHTDLTTFHLAREATDNSGADLAALRSRIRHDRAAVVAYRRHGLAGVFAAKKQLRADMLQIKKARRDETA